MSAGKCFGKCGLIAVSTGKVLFIYNNINQLYLNVRASQ